MAVATRLFDLKLPKRWGELTDSQLKYFFKMKALGLKPIDLQVYCLRRWANFKTVSVQPDGMWTIQPLKGECVKLELWQIHWCASKLSWLNEPTPSEVIYMSQLKVHKAVDKYLRMVPFGDYLVAESYYQGYLHTQRMDQLQGMVEVLYKNGEKLHIEPWMVQAILMWWYSLKLYFTREYPYLFTQTESDKGLSSADFKESIDAQIRALTGGDITKEAVVLDIDTPRALVELNAKAREAKELRKQLKK